MAIEFIICPSLNILKYWIFGNSGKFFAVDSPTQTYYSLDKNTQLWSEYQNFEIQNHSKSGNIWNLETFAIRKHLKSGPFSVQYLKAVLLGSSFKIPDTDTGVPFLSYLCNFGLVFEQWLKNGPICQVSEWQTWLKCQICYLTYRINLFHIKFLGDIQISKKLLALLLRAERTEGILSLCFLT